MPLSEVMTLGTLNVAIELHTRKSMMVSAFGSAIGTVSGQQVVLSIIVRMYLNPVTIGKGPTISTWRCSNLSTGVLIEAIGWRACRATLFPAHTVQAAAQFFTSFLIPGQT